MRHMWRWGTPQNFLLAFIDELWKIKKIRILKKWKKKKKNCWRYHHRYQKPQSYEVQFLRSGVRQNVLSFSAISCPFTPLPTRTIKILKKWKHYLEMSSFFTCAPKNTCLLRYGEWQTVFCHFRPFFTLLPNIDPKN